MVGCELELSVAFECCYCFAINAFVQKMVTYDPAKRLPAKYALNHTFFNDVTLQIPEM